MNDTPTITNTKPSRAVVALALIGASIGIDLLQTIHFLLTNPINLLETYSHTFVLGSAFGAICIGAGTALLVHLSPKKMSKTNVLYLGLFTTLLTTMLMLRMCLDISTLPLSKVLDLSGFVLLVSTLYPFSKTTPHSTTTKTT